MDNLAVLGVPWQQWGMLAAAAWGFALVCFAGAYWPRPRRTAQPGRIIEFPAPAAVLVEEAVERQRAA